MKLLLEYKEKITTVVKLDVNQNACVIDFVICNGNANGLIYLLI